MSTAIVLGAERGIILNTNRTLLAEYCGHVILTNDWAKLLILRTGFVKRRGFTTKIKTTVEHFHQLAQEFLDEVMTAVAMEDIP